VAGFFYVGAFEFLNCKNKFFMKRILIAFDGINFSEGAVEMAFHLHQLSQVQLTGAFIPQVDYEGLWSYSSGKIPLVGDEHNELLDQNITRFENACRENNVRFNVKKDYLGFALPELKKETRFFDLLLLGGESFFRNSKKDLNDYIKEALHQSECPTLVVPENFQHPRSIILAYDGSASSVYAIKCFAYLFPELCTLSTILVYSEEEGEGIPDHVEIAELLKMHYPNSRMLKLDADPDTEFKDWVNEKRRSMLVTGAFGRSLFSSLFRKSFVSDILQGHQIPVFVAHP
jgi:hypothetical protein